MTINFTAVCFAVLVATAAAGCNMEPVERGDGNVVQSEVPPVVTAADVPVSTEAPAPAAEASTPATGAALGSYANPDDWVGAFDTEEASIELRGLQWQNDVSSFNYFDEDLCETPEFGSDCVVKEGKGVLVLSYDVTRLSGEPGSFYWDHQLITAGGLVVGGSDLHCVGDDSIDLAPGGTALHETCFVVDVAQVGSQVQIGLTAGFFADPYWVLMPGPGEQ